MQESVKCIYFHQYSDLHEFKHNSSICKTIWNPMVILLMPTIEFLTEKNCFKVQNHRFSMEKWFCRAHDRFSDARGQQSTVNSPHLCSCWAFCDLCFIGPFGATHLFIQSVRSFIIKLLSQKTCMTVTPRE